MRKSYSGPVDRATEALEATRRLYRGATELARRLDEQRSCALTTADIFTPSGEVLRAKLKDYCERLIIKDPVGHARKIEELVWRRGFYDAVAAAKKLRKGNVWTDTERALLSTHLLVGVGFYHHLILRLQQECGLELAGVVDFAFPGNKCVLSNREKITPPKLQSDEARQCAIKVIHRSLICLGDLARYKLDVDPNWDPMIATRYYKMAIAIDPNIGMPHNQLGTLAGNKNYGVDAVYHYLRCILCSEPFEGTEGNLKRVISTHFYCGKEKLPSQRCAARLFTLLQKWDNDTSNIERINEDCESLLTEIESCLTMEKTNPTSPETIAHEDTIDEFLQNCKTEQLPYLTDDVVFKMVAICLMSISKLQTKDSSHVQSAIAFILSLMSKLVQIATVHLQEAVIDISLLNGEALEDNFITTDEKIQTRDSKNLDLNDNNRDKCPKKSINGVNGRKKRRDKSKSLLNKLRRPRKRISSSDSEGSETEIGSSGGELNSDISETDEEDNLSANEIFDDLSEDENGNDEVRGINNKVLENGESQVGELKSEDNVANGDDKPNLAFVAQLKKQRLSQKDLLEVLSKEGLLQSIKICCDWIYGHPDIIKIISKSSRTLLHRFAILLNLLTVDADALFRSWKRESRLNNRERFDEYVKVIPLPEDADLKGLDVLKVAHDALDWKILRNFHVSKLEQTLLRTQKLVSFGRYLAGVEDTGVSFDEAQRLYLMSDPKDLEPIKEEKKITSTENNKDCEQSRGKLMRHMGQLWLKAEVRALESRLRSKLMSAYLVPDHEALAKYTPVLKRLMYAKKFIIVIPSVVVSALDEVKRTSGRAREATRWLETQLRKGSRFLRAQRPHERLALPYIKGPRPKDKEAWLFFQIIECCHYLTQQSKVGLSSDAEPPVVTLLTGTSLEDRKNSTFSPDGLAKNAGINLEHIESFHTKWKTSSKSHG